MTVQYRGYTIVKKRDFVGNIGYDQGFLYSKGYNVTNGKMVNVMPGATFFRTPSDAKEGIDILIAVGESHFWETYWRVKQAQKEATDAILQEMKEVYST